MDGKHNPVENLEEMWFKIGFPHIFVVDVNRKWILNSPLPSHKREFRTKGNKIHNISTHKKWRVNPRIKTPFLLYSIISLAKLSDMICVESIIVALTATSIKGNHFEENLLLSGLPNSLHNIAATKQKGEQIDAVAYIPFLSFLIFSSLFDQARVQSTGLLFSLANFSMNFLF